MEQTKADTTSKKTNQMYFENRHAFIVGIDDYKYVSSLQTPINDAQKLGKLLEEKYDYKIHLCENPSGQILRAYIEKIGENVTESDCALFYFAGHGITTDSEKGIKGFIVPADGQKNDDSTLTPMSLLLEAFSQLKCKHFLVILDCCFAGAFRWAEKHRDIGWDSEKLFQQHYRYYSDNPSWQVLTSTSHTQKALDYLGERDTDDSGHSPFAHCLIDGLKGQADLNKDKIITLSELFIYLQTRFAGISHNISSAQNIGLFPLDKHGNGEFMFIPTGFDPSQLTERDYENPYMGLQAYTDDKAHLFFGRKKAKQDLLAKIESQNLTVIIGASGTGKSSLVKAGILPELRKKGSKIAEMRPNKDPISELANCRSDFNILVIDQFEEIITQSDPTKAVEFLKILSEYIRVNDKTIILTLRSDFEPQIDKKGIENAWHLGRYLIPPFMPEDLREVIITPTARVGRFIEDEKLVSEIVNEVFHYPGSLPLLSFTLSELFEICKSDPNPYRNIKYEDYQYLGGVTGSLQKSADRIAQNCTDTERLSLRNIMLRMVSIAGGETAGKRVLESDLAYDNLDKDKCVNAVIHKLVEARLVVKGLDINGNPYIEPAHDALIRAWSKLYEWIKECKEENLILLSKVTLAVHDYRSKDQDEKYLWDKNPNLRQVLELQNTDMELFNVHEKDFIQKSFEKEVNETESLKAERDQAIREKNMAVANEMSYKAELIQEREPLKALFIAYKAFKKSPTTIPQQALENIFSNNIFIKNHISTQTGYFNFIYLPISQKLFAIKSFWHDDIVERFICELDLTTLNELNNYPIGSHSITASVLKKDESIVFFGNNEGEVLSFDTKSKQYEVILNKGKRISSIDFMFLEKFESENYPDFSHEEEHLLMFSTVEGDICIINTKSNDIKSIDKTHYLQNTDLPYCEPENSINVKFCNDRQWIVFSFNSFIFTFDIVEYKVINKENVGEKIKTIFDYDKDFNYHILFTEHSNIYHYWGFDYQQDTKAKIGIVASLPLEYNISPLINYYDNNNNYKIIVGSNTGDIMTYDFRGKQQKTIKGLNETINELFFIPRLKTLYGIYSGKEKIVRTWELSDNVYYKELRYPYKLIASSGKLKGTLIISADDDNRYYLDLLWIPDNKLLFNISLDTFGINDEIEAFDIKVFDGRKEVVCRSRNTIYLFDWAKENLIFSLRVDNIGIISYSPPDFGDLIVFTNKNNHSLNLIKFNGSNYSLESYEIKPHEIKFDSRSLPAPGVGMTTDIKCIKYLNDGDTILLGLWFNVIKFSVSTGKFEVVFSGFGRLTDLTIDSTFCIAAICVDRHSIGNQSSIYSNKQFPQLKVHEQVIIFNIELGYYMYAISIETEDSNYRKQVPRKLRFIHENRWLLCFTDNYIFILSIALKRILYKAKISYNSLDFNFQVDDNEREVIVCVITNRIQKYVFKKPYFLISQIGEDAFKNDEEIDIYD